MKMLLKLVTVRVRVLLKLVTVRVPYVFGLFVWGRAMLSFCMTWEGSVSFVIHDVCNRPSAFASDLRDEPIQVLSRWLGFVISTYRSECQVVIMSLSY